MNENSDTQMGLDDSIEAEVDQVLPEDQKPQNEKRQHRDRSKREHHKGKRKQRFFLGWILEFKFELLALVSFGLGVFLLLAPFKISTWLFGHARQALGYARDIAGWLIGSVLAIEKSDIGGVVMLAAAIGLVGFDIRLRILRRHEQIEAEPLCAKCGNQMRRARTSRFQQGLGTVFRVRIKHFSCSKCGHRTSVWRPPHESDW